MNDDFTIELSSDLKFEGMVVEISFRDTTIARLDYEKGANNIEIDFLLQYPLPNAVKFNLDSFLRAIDRAKKLAIECAKQDELRNQSKLESKDSDSSDL